MERKEELRVILNKAQFNGFEFRQWYQVHIPPVWPGAEQALAALSCEGRYYALLFSHDFARAFWRTGSQISFAVPATVYHRVNTRGDVIEVTRKPFMRRSNRPGVWKYHLRAMAASEDPIEYICRFLRQPDAENPAEVPIGKQAVEA